VSIQNRSDSLGPPYRKPRANLYTALLALALLAIVIATLVLYLEMGLYEYKIKGRTSAFVRPAAAQLALLRGTAPDSILLRQPM
jgi:hypothetical protein